MDKALGRTLARFHHQRNIDSSSPTSMAHAASPPPSEGAPNGADGLHTPAPMPFDTGRAVLTLFGGDQRAPKQLFSSLGKRKSPGDVDLSNVPLPNGISTTRIVPTHSLEAKEGKKSTTTFRDNYPPPPNLPALQPPRPSTKTATKSGSIGWYTPSVVSKPDRRGNFMTQPLPTGNWLTYNATPAPRQDSPETKRKQRERALSFGAAQSPTNEEAKAAHNQAKNDALFKSVYSSFAPARDDSFALVAARQKSQMWWYKYGEEMYQELLDIKDQELYGPTTQEIKEDVDGSDIQDVLDDWVPPESTRELTITSEEKIEESSSKDAADLLNEISDLLETLISHQRIRNEALAPNTRSSTGSLPNISGSTGHPSSPSAAESDTYETLRSHLALIVSELPPYMLAKLDGDKLGALNISTKIRVEGPNQRGTLMEDELSTRARAARTPVPTVVTQTPGVFPNVRGAGGYHPQSHTPSTHYSRPPYSAQAPAQRPPMPHSYSSGHYAGRPAATVQYTPGSTRPTYPTATYSADSRTPSGYLQRYANGSAQHGTPQNHSSYSNGYRSQGHQASSYVPQYSTPQPRIPSSAAATMQAYRSTQSDFQPRPSPTVPVYGYGASPAGVTVSPQPHHRPSFSAQGQSPNPQRPPLYQQHSSTQGSRTSAEPSTNGAGATGRISPDEPAVVMSRQKAQLAERSSSRQNSKTPQPILENGGQPNGAPSVQ